MRGLALVLGFRSQDVVGSPEVGECFQKKTDSQQRSYFPTLFKGGEVAL